MNIPTKWGLHVKSVKSHSCWVLETFFLELIKSTKLNLLSIWRLDILRFQTLKKAANMNGIANLQTKPPKFLSHLTDDGGQLQQP